MTTVGPVSDVRGMTIALNAGDTAAVLDFYTLLFDRGPDTAPMDDFLEWQICSGTWLQLSTGHQRPGANNARVRFEVDDIAASAARMAGAGIPVGETVTVPDIVAFANFSDHWGNALGFYQLLSPRNILSEAQRRRDARERAEASDLVESGADPDEQGEPVDGAVQVPSGQPAGGATPVPGAHPPTVTTEPTSQSRPQP